MEWSGTNRTEQSKAKGWYIGKRRDKEVRKKKITRGGSVRPQTKSVRGGGVRGTKQNKAKQRRASRRKQVRNTTAKKIPAINNRDETKEKKKKEKEKKRNHEKEK